MQHPTSNMNSNTCTEYDIIMVGAGLVGASMALALANSDFKIAILEKLPNSQKKEATDTLQARALALSYPSLQWLQKYLQTLCPHTRQKLFLSDNFITEVQVSAQGKFGVTRLQASEQNLPFLGGVVNADALNQALADELTTLPNIDIFRPIEITNMIHDREHKFCKVLLNTGKVLSAKLIIAADGAESFVRQHQGIDLQVHDYHQTAIVVNVDLAQPAKGIAYERFTKTGSLAILPFGEKRVKCVWILPKDQAEKQMQAEDRDFLQEIQTIFGNRLGRFQAVANRVAFPLKNLKAEALYGPRFVLIGNAANTVHPIAAQGFNLGLRDVASLQSTLHTAQQAQQDIGSIEILKQYAQKRTPDHRTIQQFSHFLATSSLPTMSILPSGLNFLKNWIMDQGFGRS